MQSIVNNNQSMLDIAIQDCGTIEAAFSISCQSDISLSEELPVGQSLKYEPDVLNKAVVSRLLSYGAKPATNLTQNGSEILSWFGINYMGIEIDFLVG